MIFVRIDRPKSCAECPMSCRTSDYEVLCRNDMRKHTVMDDGCPIIGDLADGDIEK